VFISYTTHSDVDLAARERLCDILGPLCRARTLDGDPWKVWVDDRCLHAGDDPDGAASPGVQPGVERSSRNGLPTSMYEITVMRWKP
jgi:hypothetical protein